MNNLKRTNPFAVCTNPVNAAGIEAPQSTTANNTLAPYLSHSGPSRKRIAIVPPTPAIDEFHISCFVKSSVAAISDNNGDIANQMKKAMKNDHLFVYVCVCVCVCVIGRYSEDGNDQNGRARTAFVVVFVGIENRIELDIQMRQLLANENELSFFNC